MSFDERALNTAQKQTPDRQHTPSETIDTSTHRETSRGKTHTTMRGMQQSKFNTQLLASLGSVHCCVLFCKSLATGCSVGRTVSCPPSPARRPLLPPRLFPACLCLLRDSFGSIAAASTEVQGDDHERSDSDLQWLPMPLTAACSAVASRSSGITAVSYAMAKPVRRNHSDLLTRRRFQKPAAMPVEGEDSLLSGCLARSCGTSRHLWRSVGESPADLSEALVLRASDTATVETNHCDQDST